MPCQEFSGSSPKRRRAEEKDEGIGSPDTLEEEKVEELRREMLELRQQLDKERAARMQMEEQVSREEEESVWECGFTCFVPSGLCHSGHDLATSLSEAAAAGVDTSSHRAVSW